MIDVLRGVAVFMVMIRHLAFNVSGFTQSPTGSVAQYPGDWFNSIAVFGEYGVHLFLALSGFCIHFRWARTGVGSVPFLPFWKRRLIRLYPPFFIVLCVSITALFTLHGFILKAFPDAPIASWFGYASGKQLAIDILLLLTLTQNLNGASQRIGNGPFWSLALEEQLYLLYFPFLWLRRNFGWSVALAIPLIATLTWRIVGVCLFESPPQFWFVTAPAFWVCWCLGALAAEHSTGLSAVPRIWSTPLAIGTTFVLAVYSRLQIETMRGPYAAAAIDVGLELLIGFVWFQVLLVAIRYEPAVQCAFLKSNWGNLLWKPLAWLGMCSYSVYLLHDIAFTAIKQFCIMMKLPLPMILCLRFSSGIIVGWMFYKTVEKYFHDKSKRVEVKGSQPMKFNRLISTETCPENQFKF